MIGRQKIDGIGLSQGSPSNQRMPSNRMPIELDLYIPVYTILQFFFYMGLLKVSLHFLPNDQNSFSPLEKNIVQRNLRFDIIEFTQINSSAYT